MGVSYISLWDITSELGLVMLWDRFYLLFYLAFLMSYVHVSLSWCIFEEISFVQNTTDNKLLVIVTDVMFKS